jgi:outer membrane protein assembly factor BamB
MSKNFELNLKPKRRQTLLTVALVLMLTMTATLITTQHVAALSEANIYVYGNPNPVGTGQTMIILGWITPLPSYTLPNIIHWTDVYVDVVRPDGKIDSFGPITCDSVASFWFNYVPDAVGNYTIKASWNGNSSAAAQAFIYAPTSTTYQFSVQEQQVLSWPAADLPEGYWQRPINAENREWSVLAGSWLYVQGSARGGYDAAACTDYQPYSLAPDTPHINWVLQATQGGIIGGTGAKDRGSGESITTVKFLEAVDMLIIGGLGYYVDGWNPVPSAAGATSLIGANPDIPKATDLTTFTIHCLDIRTGEEKWAMPTYSFGLSPSGGTGRTGPMIQGQIEPLPTVINSGSSGPKAYLVSIGTTFVRWDAFTGQQLFLMNNSLTGAFDGQYVYSRSGSRLIKWDTLAVGKGINNTVASAAVYNVTAPSVTFGNTTSYLSPSMLSGNVGIASYSVKYENGTAPGLAGIDLTTGKLLWNTTLYGYEGGEGTGTIGYGKYFYMAGDACWHAFDINTGNELWKTESGVLPWGKFWGYASAVAYNKFYAECYDGYIYAFDVDTGKTVWKHFSGSSGFETPYGEWPWFSPPVVADGKIYASLSEHSPTNPNWRGGKLYCFDADSGDVLWTLPWLGGAKAIADGVLVATNEYDGQVYCFGKGLTATTVTAPNVAVPLQTQVLLQGTVTDQSESKTCLGISAAGTPAISDESMSEWMSYLYMQKSKPTNATGVQVKLTAIGPDGSYQDIGTTTSDMAGIYAVSWTPSSAGLYKITANFTGSDSYYESSAETYLIVGSTSSSPAVSQPASSQITPLTSSPSPSALVESPANATPTTTLIVISAAVIVVVVIAIALVLNKRSKQNSATNPNSKQQQTP